MITSELFVPEGAELFIEAIEIESGHVVLKVAGIRATATCPYCGHESKRVNTHYHRKPADLPCAGHAVEWQMRVRSFFCDNEVCAHRTFAERFPEVVAPYVRRTERLSRQQQAVAFAMGGEAGARLLKILGMPTSPDTLIRLIRQTPKPEVATPRVLGVDDWAKKKGLSYGTILIDLEAHCVVDLLDERSAETLAAWLKAHSGVEIISRDRANDYMKGATDGAPEAMQVADRWHLLKNLRDALERLLMEKPACLRAAATRPEPADPSENDPERRSLPDVDFSKGVEVPANTQLESLTLAERQKQARRNRKQERFALVRTMHEEGLSLRELGRQLNMSYRTVSKYLQADQCPFYPEGFKRGQSKLDPFLDYLTTRWQEGCHNASQLFREIQSRGFAGSRGLVARWAVDQRQQLPSPASTTQRKALPQQSRVIPWRPARTAWLLFSSADELDEDNQLALERIKLADPDVALAHQFVQAFQQMVRDQQPNQLTLWLQDVTDSGIVALKSFVNGVRQDLAAVTNALASPWSNGQTEGHVNRLKFIKRQMYGRANFDLLRRRVLGFSALS